MDNEKWSSFIGGVVLGALLALGIAGTFGWHQLQRARAAEAEARRMAEEAAMQEQRARQAAEEALERAEAALKLQQAEKEQGRK